MARAAGATFWHPLRRGGAAVLWDHFIGDVIKEVDAFAEARSNAIYGRDVIDLVGVHGEAVSVGAP